MRYALESITRANVKDVIPVGQAVQAVDDPVFFPLPRNNSEAMQFAMGYASTRWQSAGDGLIARDPATGRVVAGGEYIRNGSLFMGYWVSPESRGNGVGRQVASEIERRAEVAFPEAQAIRLRIDPANVASQALANRLGYTNLGYRDNEGLDVYERRLVRTALFQMNPFHIFTRK